MNAKSHLERQLDAFARLSGPGFALLVHAPWGAGKTWAVRRWLSERKRRLPERNDSILLIEAYAGDQQLKTDLTQQWWTMLTHLNSGKTRFIRKAGVAAAIIIGSITTSSAEAQWSGSANIDAMTDFKGWTAQISGYGSGGEASLIVRCLDDRTDVIVLTHRVLGGSLYDRTEIGLRFDNRPAETQSWLRSTNYRAAFAADRIGIARRLALTDARQLRIRVTPYDSGGVDFVFPLAGARKQIEIVASRCGWSLTVEPKKGTEKAAPSSTSRSGSSPTDTLENTLTQDAADVVEKALQRNMFEIRGSTGSATIVFDMKIDGSGRLLGMPQVSVPTGQLDTQQGALRRFALAAIIRADEQRGFKGVSSRRLRITFRAGGQISVSIVP